MKQILKKTLYLLPIVTIMLLTVFITTPSVSAAQLKTPVLKAPARTASGIKVNWTRVSGAAKYRVFVKTGSSSWKPLAVTTGTSYVDKKVRSGVTYTYTVRCITKDAKKYTSGFDRKGVRITYFKPPQQNAVVNTARGTIISWKASAGAKKYQVYYKTTGSWKLLATTADTKYLHRNTVKHTTYTYCVRCLNSLNKVVSAFGTARKTTYNYTITPGRYTNIMLAADVYSRLGKTIKIPNYPNTLLNRQNAATILCSALGYKTRAGYVPLRDTTSAVLKAIVFYGYLYPDSADKIYPSAAVTASEYQTMLTEVSRYKKLCGKRMLAFGDSIMVGKGNNNFGIGRMAAEKYGMKYTSYAKNGATFSTLNNGRYHIPDKVSEAAAAGCKADVILLDGATNDIKLCAISTAPDTYDTQHPDKSAYAIGFHQAMKLISRTWKNTPVLYIRAHNISSCQDALEKPMGEYGLKIAKYHGAYTVDIFSNTTFNTSDASLRDRYTAYVSELGHSDGTHPNYLGYTTYYLPLITKQLYSIL